MKSKEKEVERKPRRVKPIQSWLQHHLNSVHVYCRLVRIMPRMLARKIVVYWEKTAIYELIYAST